MLFPFLVGGVLGLDDVSERFGVVLVKEEAVRGLLHFPVAQEVLLHRLPVPIQVDRRTEHVNTFKKAPVDVNNEVLEEDALPAA